MKSRITGNIDTGNVGGFLSIAYDIAQVRLKLAAKPGRETRMLPMIQIKEHSPALKAVATVKDYTLKHAVVSFEASDRILPYLNSIVGKLLSGVVGQLRETICAQHQVTAPSGQLQRKSGTVLPSALYSKGLIPHLPTIAVRAMEYAAAIKRWESVQFR